jgi:hypothetical protein
MAGPLLGKQVLHVMPNNVRLKIAVVGTGISGLSAAWLLGRRHDVTIYEQAGRLGGHSNTVIAEVNRRRIPVDTGFIVFNRVTYPNLTALFEHLKVPTQVSDMSFAASLHEGNFEYSGGDLAGLVAQRRNLVRPKFWSMLSDLRKFYRNAVRDAAAPGFERVTLGAYLDAGGYRNAFRDYHLLPMGCAIWSSTPEDLLSYSALAFIRFHANHGLLQLAQRPVWETVTGGSIAYVTRLMESFAGHIKLDTAAVSIRRSVDGVRLSDSRGGTELFDHVVIATHADQALAALADPTAQERDLLGAIRYRRNLAVLHSDPSLMPRRRSVWGSWNYVGGHDLRGSDAHFTYWMNRLQAIPAEVPLFVTLNPRHRPRIGTLHHSESYDHPILDAGAIAAQRVLWRLQGAHRTWFCGAYFGSGFHEDGLQAGLAVAEQLGGVRRPWTIADESGRIVLAPSHVLETEREAAA